MPSLRAHLLSLSLAGCLLIGQAVAAESLDDLVNRANEASNKQDYPVAIKLYEQATQKAPAEKTLKNNLAVLYANYGVSLQEQKKYDEAQRYFNKALALLPADSKEIKNIKDAQAGTYFAEAMDLRDNVQNAAGVDASAQFARMKELLDKALAISPNEPNIKKGMGSVYLEEAYQLATAEKYAEARPLLEKALTYDPQSRPIRQSLANVYLGLAKSDPDHAKDWADKAMAADDSPRVKQVAAQLLNRSAGNASTANAGEFASPGEAKLAAPRAMSKLSVAEMIQDMETQLEITPPKGASMGDRLEALETQVLGKAQSGPMATRTKAVYTALMGSTDALKAGSNAELVQAPAPSSENSYLADIFKVTDGKVIRWGKFPLRVYIETPDAKSALVSLYKPEYREAVLHGFNAWKVKTNGSINYVEVKNPDAADIVVKWADHYVDRFADPDKVPTVYKNYSPPKKSHLMSVLSVASMLTPGYFSLAPQALNAALEYKQYKKLEVLREESKIQLGLEPTKDLSAEAAKTLIQNMAAKEFGHALGLKGSSPQQGDLLYPELRSDVAQLPSSRDLQTLKDLYDRPPNIILNVR